MAEAIAWALYLIGFAAVISAAPEIAVGPPVSRGTDLALTFVVALAWPAAAIAVVIVRLWGRAHG